GTRVIGSQNRKIGGGGAGSSAGPAAAPQSEQHQPRRRRWRVAVIVLLVLVLAAAAAFYPLRADDSAAQPEEPASRLTVAGEARNINLAEGHYLRLGFAIELVEGAEEVATPRATDIAIGLFSGRTVAEVNDPEQRAALQAQLTEQLDAAYDGEVRSVYFTDFVTQ